jgi:hypothetical protein
MGVRPVIYNNLKIQIISIFTKLNFTEDPNICLFHLILASCQWDSSRLLNNLTFI